MHRRKQGGRTSLRFRRKVFAGARAGPGVAQTRYSSIVGTALYPNFSERFGLMDMLNDWKIMGGLIVLLVALVGVMLYMKNKKDD